MLKALQVKAPSSSTFTLIGVSYRGFWTSRGRPSEHGIGLDAAAAIDFVSRELPQSTHTPIDIVLWGQSIGAGVATSAAAKLALSQRNHSLATPHTTRTQVSGLLLETPFVSVRAMLTTIYPQKWLPYRYLGPFLRNHWDSRVALQTIGDSSISPSQILILQAANDELVPSGQGLELEEICKSLNINVERKVVSNTLHTEVAAKPQGRQEIVGFLESFG